MLFSSHEFIFLFLPVVLAVYFFLSRGAYEWLPRAWLAAASLFFYGWFHPAYLFLILSSIFVNFSISKLQGLKVEKPWRLATLIVGLVFNVGLLGYYKYYDFLVENVNLLTGWDWAVKGLLLPLGISFITFQQISFLVDCYHFEEPTRYSLVNYALFILFFPQLIAGPIVLHHEFVPQINRPGRATPNPLNLAAGLHLFAIGLGKKVILADTFAPWANPSFDVLPSLTFWQAWVAVLAYTLQIYFDFSGYCDMAMGIARMFNIHLPANFNSPYRAVSIKDFWLRWHMTLGRFLSHHVYFPLGGNRRGRGRTYLNLLATFLISGLWHGAAWTFVLWGALHGAAIALHRLWNDLGFRMHRRAGRALTLLFVICAWAFFRARTAHDAVKVLKGMFLSHDFSWAAVNFSLPPEAPASPVPYWLAGGFAIVLLSKNAMEKNHTFQPSWRNAAATVLLLLISILSMSRISPFIYYNF